MYFYWDFLVLLAKGQELRGFSQQHLIYWLTYRQVQANTIIPLFFAWLKMGIIKVYSIKSCEWLATICTILVSTLSYEQKVNSDNDSGYNIEGLSTYTLT